MNNSHQAKERITMGNNENSFDVIVVGGGAAGMMAAGQAAARGASVILLEKNDRLGRKIEISGKGRCNLTNAEPIEDFFDKYYENGRFLRGILHDFDNNDLIAFFAHYGVETKIERGGRVFPVADDAQAVNKALQRFLKETGVNVKLSSPVQQLRISNGHVLGVATSSTQYDAKAVIVCTGGASYPATGSTGDGYRWAAACGHQVIPPRPALVPLKTAEQWVKQVQGLALRNVEVTLWVNGENILTHFGEMLFTHFGVSGPIILTLSRTAGDHLRQGHLVQLTIDLKPALSEERLDLRLQRDFAKYINKHFKNALNDLLPKSLIPVIIDLIQIDPNKPVHQITKTERKALVTLLKKLPLTITGTLPLAAAIVTAGGVDVKEINPKTMESKLIKGLYWAGEVVDVDGVTGGYNLQAAFSMGFRAGKAAAEYARLRV